MAPEGIREPQRGLTAEGFRPTQEMRSYPARERCAPEVGGREIADLLAFPTGHAVSPVRTEKMALVRRRIAEGFYERPEIKAELADHLLHSLGEPSS